MHRLFAPFLAIGVLLAMLAPVPGHAADADNKGIKLEFDAAVLQRMSAFVSAFSEVDPQGRWHRIDDAAQADPQWLVTFGVLHNWMHNAPAFTVEDGQAGIDAAVVAATIEEYTGLKFDSHAAVPQSGIGFADGRYAIAADTPREGPQAVVLNVFAMPDNALVMSGHVADKRAEDGAQVGQDDLQVRVAHQQWKGKDCWKLLSWSWEGKPEAKPAAPAVAQPVEEPVTQPAEQPETENAPVAEPAPADKAADAPAPEAQPATENQPAAEPAAIQHTEEMEPERAPAAPSETESAPAVEPEPQPEPVDNAPATEPETQPESEAAPAPQPATEPVTEPVAETTPETPATAAAEPATPEATAETAAQPQTVIPFTASTEPDFSEVLAIAVPAGWNHRNTQGVLELTPEAEDAWLVVEAVRLGKRDPQKALKVFSGGAALTPYGAGGASFIFTSEGSTGHREHMIVVDAEANIICRLTWQTTEAHKDAIAAILNGLRVNGRAVAG